MFYGPGAGELPTATAVVSDLVTVVKNRKLGVNGRGMVAPYKEKILKDDSQKLSKYFLRIVVADKRGVLAQITQLLADKNISLEQVIQQPYNNDKEAEIIMITHLSSKSDMDGVLAYMEQMDIVTKVKSCYRVEGGEQK